MDEKIISPKEAEQLVIKLKMKYGAEAQAINLDIQRDIDLLGYVSLETHAKQKNLEERILKEKENYE